MIAMRASVEKSHAIQNRIETSETRHMIDVTRRGMASNIEWLL